MNASKRAEQKYFTPEEANQTLPLVQAIVGDIVKLFHDVHERRERLAKVRQLRGDQVSERDMYSEELDQMEREIEKDIERLEEFISELHELGVELKDPVKGLVDFPTKIEGRDAYLCWKRGEDEVLYWHESDAGFAGRQPLLETSVSFDNSEEE